VYLSTVYATSVTVSIVRFLELLGCSHFLVFALVACFCLFTLRIGSLNLNLSKSFSKWVLGLFVEISLFWKCCFKIDIFKNFSELYRGIQIS